MYQINKKPTVALETCNYVVAPRQPGWEGAAVEY